MPEPRVHELKTWPVYFRLIESGQKPWEYRKDDRNFAEGDTLRLREFDPCNKPVGYTGRQLDVRVTQYVNNVPGLPEGYCIMTIERMERGGVCCSCGYDGEEETPCPAREDKTHCVHWWDSGEVDSISDAGKDGTS